MTTNISPVTENDMREFFERIVSTVVGYSEQSKKIDDLSSQIEQINGRLSNVITDNQRLRVENDGLKATVNEKANAITYMEGELAKQKKETEDAWNLVRETEDERNKAREEGQQARREVNETQDKLTAVTQDRDSLTTRLDSEGRRRQEVEAQVAQCRETIAEKDRKIVELETNYKESESMRDYLKNELDHWKHEHGSAQEKLKAVQDKMEALRSLFN